MIYFKKTIFLLVLISISLFSCKKDSEQQNTNSENPCQSDCVETKEIFTSPANDIVFTTTNEYVIIADKKFISKKSILVAPNNQLNIWRYEYDNLGNILEFSNENIRTIDQTVSRTISQKYMYENGVLVRKNSYQDNELYGYVIYEYTQGINKYTKIIIYDTLGQTNFSEMYEYDARGNNTKILFYTDDELESYITFEFDENNNEVAYRRGSVFSTDVVERISVYSDCLLLKSESTKNGQITATTTNTIEDGLIVAKEIINSRGEITRNYTYEYDCE